MSLPNLFIAGAPKCGTTAMYHYLGGHQDVFLSPIKEPHYFAEDLSALESRVKSLDDYLSLFNDAGSDRRYLVEASVWYLYSSSAIEAIHRFNPAAKILVMLRNPIDLVNALHLDYCCGCIETEFDLEKAWRLSKARQEGAALPRSCPYAKLLDYQAVGQLGEQVARLLAVFPREQVRFVLFDDFAGRPLSAYRDTLTFLGVSDDGRTAFPRVNESIVNRARKLTNWLGISPDRHLRAATAFKRLFGDDRLGVVRTLKRMNTVKARRPVAPWFRRTMREYYESDVGLLSTLVDRDLSHWT